MVVAVLFCVHELIDQMMNVLALVNPNTRRSLFEVLQRILMGTDVVKNVNKNNASHAVLF